MFLSIVTGRPKSVPPWLGRANLLFQPGMRCGPPDDWGYARCKLEQHRSHTAGSVQGSFPWYR